MAFNRGQLKSELIDQVLERVHSRLEGARAADADRVVRAFYDHVPPDDILDEQPENLYGAALTLWALARERQPGENKVRVYNPRQESHGWKSTHTIVDVVIDDMPFLVDSLTAAIQALDADVHLVVYPVIHVRRDSEGRIVELVDASEAVADDEQAGGVLAEALMHFQISEQRAVAHDIVHQTVSAVLSDVRAAVDDWPKMRQHCADLVEEIRQAPPPLPAGEIAEGTEFLEWLADNNFTFLGYRENSFTGECREAVARVVPGRGMGILRQEEATIFAESRSLAPMPARSRRFLRRP